MAKETATYETMMVLSLANGEDNVQTPLTNGASVGLRIRSTRKRTAITR